MNGNFSWIEARRTQDALAHLTPGSLLKAGGVDLMDRLKEGLDQPKTLVNIRNVAELQFIREAADGLHLGPLVTLAEIAARPEIRERYTALADAAGHAATPQIRNMATVGGNILQRPRCWYFRNEEFHCKKKGGTQCFAQDGENEYHAIFDNRTCAIVHPSAAAVALVALGASIRLSSEKGTRDVRLEDFFVTPEQNVRVENSLRADELLAEIVVPTLPAGTRSAYMKIGEKQSFDWPIAEVAVALQMQSNNVQKASVILGAAAPVPYRAKSAEAALSGKAFSAETAKAAGVAALEGATPLRNNQYKVQLLQTAVRRTLLTAAGMDWRSA